MTAVDARERAARDFGLEGFRDFLALESGHSDNTVEAYLRDVRRLAEFAAAKGVRDPGQVSRPLLRDFVYLLKDLGLSAATIRREISAVRTYFGFLVGEGRVAADPSDRLESPRRGRVLPDTLSVRDVEALLAAPDIDQPLAWRDRALLELAYGAGLRVSELCGLLMTDLLLTENLVRVFGKGGKERLVPIGRSVIGAVSVYLHQLRPELDRGRTQGRLLLNGRGQPLSRVGAWGIVKRGGGPGRPQQAGHPPHPAATASPPICWRAAPTCGGAGDAGPRGPLHHTDLHPRRPRVPPLGPQTLPSAGLAGATSGRRGERCHLAAAAPGLPWESTLKGGCRETVDPRRVGGARRVGRRVP